MPIQIIEDLLELMYRCTFYSPISYLQSIIDQKKSPSTILPSEFDPVHSKSCSFTVEGAITTVVHHGGGGLAVGAVSLSSGRYTWKVYFSVVEKNKIKKKYIVYILFFFFKGFASNIQLSNLYWCLSEAHY